LTNTQDMSNSNYFLSKHCFVCRIGFYWIILDAKRDKYLCVAHGELSAIAARIHGWQCESTASIPPVPQEAKAIDLVDSLISREIITMDPRLGKPFVESLYPTPDRSIERQKPFAKPDVPARCIVRFILACGTTDWRLRRHALCRTLARIERRRTRARSFTTTAAPALVSTLVGIFKALRPFYPRPYLCLFDSLALLEFLAVHGFFPRLVFGVVADPFQAHCWLQVGSQIVDDDLERVSRYKPILST
jgi:hypothetical protein